MGWIDDLYGQTVGLDTAPLIYFIEQHPQFIALVRPFFLAVERGNVQVATSALTLTEVLVVPIREQNHTLVRKYEDILLDTENLTTLTVSATIASRAAEIRARHGIKTPDAIQLATAIEAGASAFLTNDTRLAGVTSIRIILLSQLLT